jgi:hypothetical protein
VQIFNGKGEHTSGFINSDWRGHCYSSASDRLISGKAGVGNYTILKRLARVYFLESKVILKGKHEDVDTRNRIV